MSSRDSATAAPAFARSRRLALVAGEASGDLLGGALLSGLRERLSPDSQYVGIGGQRMRAAGFHSQWPLEVLSVNGYVEVLRSLPAILKIRRELTAAMLAEPPDVYVGIDAPDFNFTVERTLRERGIPTLHLVSPSIWAWRGGRIHGIARAVDHMLCLFPFEKAIYDRAGVRASYVGHPMADEIPLQPDPAAARQRAGLPASGPVVAVMPGSRRSEIALIAPLFIEAMALMQQREPALRFVIPAASAAVRGWLAPLLAARPGLNVTVLDGDSRTALEAANAALVKSGTSTLEAALYKKPMVISYKVPWLTAQIMKRQGHLPYVGLPNILAGRFVVPELLQHFATPEALADAVFNQLHNEANRRNLVELFTGFHQTLRCDTAARSAEIVASWANGHESRARAG